MIEAPEITMTPIATNRFLPDGQSVCLYEANGASNLTLGQLANAISVRLACVYESRSVSISNRMSSADYYIQAMSAVGEQIDTIVTAMESKMDELNTFSQEKMIELQSATNKRDQAYDLASAMLKSFNTVLTGIASNY